MQLRLPSGIILNAPDGADPKKVVAGYRASRRAQLQEQYDSEAENPADSMGTAGRLGAGFDRGLVGLGKRVTNLALPDSLTPDFATDEAIKEHDQLMSGLDKTTAGKVGRFASETLATLPIGGAVGKGLAVGGKALLANAGATGAKRALGRALASRALQVPAEGAGIGLAVSDPGERVEGATFGAGVGTILHGGGKGLTRTMQGVVRKSKAAQYLENQSDIHGRRLELPLAEAADDSGVSGAVKGLYRHILPYVPGVSSRLGRQSEKAGSQIREVINDEVTAMGPAGNATKFQAPAGAGTETRQMTAAGRKAFDETYDQTVKSYDFNTPEASDFSTHLKKILPRIDSTSHAEAVQTFASVMKRFSSGQKSLSGDNLLQAREAIQGALAKATSKNEREALAAAKKWIDQHIDTELMQGGKKSNIEDLVRFQQTKGQYKNFPQVQEAVDSAVAEHGNYSGKQLLQKLGPKARDGESVTDLAQAMHDTVGQGIGKASPEGRVLVGAGAGVGIGFGALPAVAGLTGVGHVLANKSTQKFLLGNHNWQKMAADYIRRHPGTSIKQAVRALAAKEAADDDDDES